MSNRRPQIERLSEESWARIKRKVFAQLDAEEAQRPIFDPRKRRALPIWAFVLSGAAAAVMVTLAVRRPNLPPVAQQPSHIVTHDSGTHVSYGELLLEVAAQSALV